MKGIFKPVFIEASTLDDAWFQCLNQVMDQYKYPVAKGSHEGTDRYEFDSITVVIYYPGQRPLIPTVPAGVPPPTDMNYVNNYLPYLLTGQEPSPNETYTYGERIFSARGRIPVTETVKKMLLEKVFAGRESLKLGDGMQIQLEQRVLEAKDKDGRKVDYLVFGEGPDQAQVVIDTFKNVGEGWNQGCIEIGMPWDAGTLDPPCLRLIDCRLRYGALHFFVYFRSWDLWGGFPSNLAAVQLMKEWMAKEIGVDDGVLVCHSKGLHIYGHAKDVVEIRTRKGGSSE